MSKITLAEVRRIAALARIGLSDKEAEQMTDELDRMVGFIEQLQSVDTRGVQPTDQVTGLVDVYRPDEVRQGLSHEQLFANAPAHQDGFFKVKRVLNND
jgi:aspartyl-tRNA(Asn)/glutamyl-tRNA(Gln) amidotransferase subunit C